MINVISTAAFDCIINCFRLLKIIPYRLSIRHRLCSAVVSTFASQPEGQGFNGWTSGSFCARVDGCYLSPCLECRKSADRKWMHGSLIWDSTRHDN